MPDRDPPPPVAMTADESLSAAGGLARSWVTSVRRWLDVAAAVGLAVAGAYALGYCRGRASVELPPPALAPLIVSGDALDSVYVRDTVRLTRWRTRYDTARVTDTLWRDSVVYVRRDVADAAVAGCSMVMSDCDRIRAHADTLARLVIRLSNRSCPDHRVSVVAGYGAQLGPQHELTHGWSVTAGVRLWSLPWP